MTTSRGLGLLAGLFLVAVGSNGAGVPAVPLGDFFRDYTFDEIRISPNGSKVAALSMWKEHLNLYVIDMKTKRPVQLTGMDGQDVADVRWVGDDRLIFTCRKDGYYTGGLFAIDADGKNSRALAASVEQQAGKGTVAIRSTDFLDYYGKSKEEILVVSNERRGFDPDAYRMNVRTGIKTMAARNPGGIQEWVADSTGAVRVGFGKEGRESFVIYRENAKSEWREVTRIDFLKGTIEPLTFDQADKLLYVRSSVGRDTAALCLFDPAKGEIVRELFADPVYDMEGVITARKDRALLGYAFEAEKTRFVWTEPKMQKLQQLLDQELPGTANRFYSHSLDDEWAVILASNDRTPGTFYLFNTKELTLEKLIDRADWLKPESMSEMKPVTYTARDGRTIHGYLTLPAGVEPKNLPLVVNPHGGPWVRDTWGFSDEVQFLASRGYAVLQMNFRGSTGYGEKHLQAGYGQWGLAMQDDITDGVKWAIAQGVADPSRVAIYGGSYGGYAAMAGVAFTPDLYRCGINYVGVTDISLLLDTIPKAWEVSRASLEVMAGDKRKNREQLEATSVIKNADKIKVPVFFAYGERDDRIDMHHATRLANQLRHNGVPVTWMTRPDEGHGYRRWENKIAFYTELERFLAENMVKFPPLKVLEMPVGTPVKD